MNGTLAAAYENTGEALRSMVQCFTDLERDVEANSNNYSCWPMAQETLEKARQLLKEELER